MGYNHMFYAVAIAELKKTYGSKNDKLLEEILAAKAEEIERNDAFFEDQIKDGSLPDTATALREIVYGNPRSDVEGAIYCYAFKILCMYLGEPIYGSEGDVSDVSDHPYDSLLVKAGMPIPIPEPADFPEIGHLEFDQLDQEIALAKGDHKKIASDSAQAMSELRNVFESLGFSLARPSNINPDDIRDDINAYVEILESARKMGKGVVSFRY